MEAGELEYASKTIQVLSISGGTISQDPDKDVGTATKVRQIVKKASKAKGIGDRGAGGQQPPNIGIICKNKPQLGRNQP